MKFADPKNDLAFKKIFGDESKKEILISLVNAILGFTGGDEVVDITIANPYQVPKIEELKETILDIKARNRRQEHFIIEMQKKDLGNFTKRSLYYTSKAYVGQLEKGKDYSKLEKVYFIGILNFNLFDGDNFITRHLILNRETMKQEIADFEFAFIELPKFNKELRGLETILDKWVYFLKNARNLSIIPKEYENITEFTEAFKIATQQLWKKEEMEVYEYIALKEMDEREALRTAEERGKEQGIKQGMQLKARENAKKMKEKGYSVNEIAEITGLSEEEVRGL